MADPEQLARLKQGIEVWNDWRSNQKEQIQVDLSEADLAGLNLASANLSFANLYKVKLYKAKLTYINVTYANLAGANLTGANLGNVNVSSVVLRRTLFANVHLSLTSGLHSVIHGGPSTIGIDTFFRSKGAIPRGSQGPVSLKRWARV